MSTLTIVSTSVDERIQTEASAVLATMGLTVSDIFRIMLTRIAQEKTLPFEPLIPNTTTIQAMQDARSGKLENVTLNDLQALLDDAND